MTEQEYIDATNLAKLRIVTAILRDCIIPEKKNEDRKINSSIALYEIIEDLEKVVSTV